MPLQPSVAKSLRGLAQFLMSRPQLSDINIIRAITNLDSLQRIAARHGFEVIRDQVKLSPWQRVHRFGQNILFGLLTLACHSGRARPRKFSRSRQVIYLARGALDCKYIAAARGHNQSICVGEQQKNLLWHQEAEAPSTVGRKGAASVPRKQSFNSVGPCGCAASTRRRRFRASDARAPPPTHRSHRYR